MTAGRESYLRSVVRLAEPSWTVLFRSGLCRGTVVRDWMDLLDFVRCLCEWAVIVLLGGAYGSVRAGTALLC